MYKEFVASLNSLAEYEFLMQTLTACGYYRIYSWGIALHGN